LLAAARRPHVRGIEHAAEDRLRPAVRRPVLDDPGGLDDPLAQETLEAEDFYWLGKSFRELGVPLFSFLEGGYSRDLPNLIFAYLKGLNGK
jgi:hypothetical protein